LRQFLKDVRAVLGRDLRAMGAHVDDGDNATLHATAVCLAVLNLALDNLDSRRDVEMVIRSTLGRLVSAPLTSDGVRNARRS
jgi:hypothetical protein